MIGWNDCVREKAKTAKFWHTLWNMNDRPSTGWVAQIRRRTRAEYHRAIKELKKEKDEIVKDRLSIELCDGDSRKFWNSVNKLKRGNEDSSIVIKGKSGKDACDVFKNKYQSLYNQLGRDDAYHEALDSTNKKIVKTCKCNIRSNDNHFHSVTVNNIISAVNSMKKGQYDENAKQYSDALINGTQKLCVILSKV